MRPLRPSLLPGGLWLVRGTGAAVHFLRSAQLNQIWIHILFSWAQTPSSKPYVSTCVGDRSGRKDLGPKWTDCHDLKL